MKMAFCILLLVMTASLAICKIVGSCEIPEEYRGDWYSMEMGKVVFNVIKETKWELANTSTELVCKDIYVHPTEGVSSQNGRNVTMLMTETTNGDSTCYYCVDVLWRTLNILQYRKSECLKSTPGNSIGITTSCTALYQYNGLPPPDATITLFSKDPWIMNCSTTVQGVYEFDYQKMYVNFGLICHNDKSQLNACQYPGSPYVDNQVFWVTYGYCSLDGSYEGVQEIMYQCLGTWNATLRGVYYKYSVIADVREDDPKKKYKCMMTLGNNKGHTTYWAMSRFSDCSQLYSIYEAPEILVLKPIPRPSKFMVPKCNLPINLVGDWISDKQQKFTINGTHVIVQTLIGYGLETEDSYYSCQQTNGTKYLMTKDIAGHCEIDVLCFDIEPRNGSTVRYKIGKPYRDPWILNTMVEFDPTQFPDACNFNESDVETISGVLTSFE